MESLNDDFTFPKGCPPKAKGGEGIFFDADTEDGISIWIDMDLGERQTYIRDIVVSHLSSSIASEMIDDTIEARSIRSNVQIEETELIEG